MATSTVHRLHPRVEQAEELRTEEPLIPPPPVQKSWSPLSAVTVARLVAWRELHSRWPLHVLMALFVAATWVSPAKWEDGFVLLAAASLLPYGIALGLSQQAREDAFWTGLGGSPQVREATAMVLQLGIVGALTVLIRADDPSLVYSAASVAAVGIVLAGFARSWAQSLAGRLMVGAGTLLLTLVTLLPSLQIGAWSLNFGAQLRFALLTVLCLVARVALAGRRPSTAAGRRRRGWLWVAFPLSTVVVSVPEAFVDEPLYHHASTDGLLMIPSTGHAIAGGQRVWRADVNGYTKLDLSGPIDRAYLHDSGSIVYERGRVDFDTPQTIGLLTADGTTVECAVPDDDGLSWPAPDGQSVLRMTEGGGTFELSVDGGCSAAGPIPEALPHELGVLNQGRALKGWPAIRHGPGAGRVTIPAEGKPDRILNYVTGENE